MKIQMLKIVEPGNTSRARAYPPRTPAKREIAVEATATQRVFQAHWTKRVSWNSILQCSRVGSRTRNGEMRRL